MRTEQQIEGAAAAAAENANGAGWKEQEAHSQTGRASASTTAPAVFTEKNMSAGQDVAHEHENTTMKLMSTLQPLKELLGQLTATSSELPENMPIPPGVERRTVDMMATFASGESGTMLQRQRARRVEAIKRQESNLPVYAEEQGRMALVGQGRINGVPVEARLSDEHNRELLPARSSRWLWSAEPEAEAKAAFAPDTSLPPNARATPVLLHVSDSGEPVSATAVAEATKRYGIARRALQKVQLALGMAAKALGFLVVSERRRRGLPSLANLVRIVSAEWLTWLRRETNGQKKTTTHPDVSKQGQPAGFGASFQRYFRRYDPGKAANGNR